MEKIIEFYIGYDPLILENIIASIQVLLAYTALSLLLPAFFLGSFVKGRSFGFRILFYQVFSNVYINIFSFVLVYTNTFNPITVWALMFVIPFIIKIILIRKRIICNLKLSAVVWAEVLEGTYSYKVFIRDRFIERKNKIIRIYNKYLKGRIFEIMSLAFILISCFMFFTSVKYSLEGYRYAAADEEVHLYWIQSLLQGNAFPSGLYPHAMHFLYSVISSMFGINSIEGYLAIGPTFTFMIMFTLYFVLRDLFKSKYAIIAGLAIYLIADTLNNNAYFRYKLAIPMEFGMIGMIGTIFALIYYIRKPEKLSWWLFILSIVWSTYSHFYDSIWIVFLLIPMAGIFFFQAIKKKILLKIMLGGIISVIIAVSPFGVGLVMGYPFEQSMAWALSIIDDSTGVSEATGETEETAPQETTVSSDNTNDIEKSLMQLNAEEESLTQEETLPDEQDEKKELSLPQKFILLFKSYMFSEDIVTYFVLISNTAMLIFGVAGLFLKKLALDRHKATMYILFSSLWFMSAIVFSFDILGLPVILATSRCTAVIGVLSVPVFAFPFMLIGDIIGIVKNEKISKLGSKIVAFCSWVCIVSIFLTGYVKSERYYYSTLTQTDAIIAEMLIENEKPLNWTIVTSTNSLTLIRGYGYHYEISDLMAEIYRGKTELYLPTSEIYVTVEKDARGWSFPIYVGQNELLPPSIPVSEQLALENVFHNPEYDSTNSASAYVDFRPQIMSKLYYWMEAIKVVYPSEVSVYYESDEATVYKIEQDPYFLLNLSIDYMTDLINKQQQEQ